MSAVAQAPRSVGVVGTALAHGLLVVAIYMVARTGHREQGVAYAVTLVAAPAPTTTTTRRAADPTPPPEKVVPVKPKPVKTAPVKAPPKAAPKTEVKPPPKAQPKTEVTPLAGETPSTGQDVLTKTFPGLDFPDKDYLARIMNQIYQRFPQDWQGDPEAMVGFTIHRDGSVTDITLLKKSRNLAFNNAARDAVTRAGEANAFGPLPRIWPDDKLDISFSFTPRKP